ncbi:MAG: glycosyltransferase family 2 protein [Pseudomonadota bacterium]|nr:glycosyltransferase family 2 protein [Pseudomonadota bacterium]
MKLSIILPCLNEAASLMTLIPQLKQAYPESELIVVDDGSSDDSAAIARKMGAKVIHHPLSLGNGAAIKSGARHAQGDILVFMDADGQHDPKDIHHLLTQLKQGYDMSVGARYGQQTQASIWRWWANRFYNTLASWMVGAPIADLTSGFRAVKAHYFLSLIDLLPNTFSYPTTVTMAFFRCGYSVGYVPITIHSRLGQSHIKPLRDGLRFLIIIFKIGTLYAPLKLFGPLSLSFLFLGLSYYAYTFITAGRFTNMGLLLLITSLLIFLIGLLSEQITQLLYTQRK